MPERTEATIRAEIDAAQVAYLAVVDTEPRAVVQAASDAVKPLRAELTALLSAGTVPCPRCHTAPHGMLKREAVGDAAPIYEVGCLTCVNASRGWTSSLAVERWNAGEFVTP